MNLLRYSLIGGILIVLFLLVIRWNEFQERQLAQVTESAAQPTLVASPSPTDNSAPPDVDIEAPPAETSDIPDTPLEPQSAAADNEIPENNAPRSALISVDTNTLQVLIDTHGGDIVKVSLPKYYAKLNEPDNPFVLLNRTTSHTYVAQSGLVGKNGTDTKDGRPIFSATATEYQLGNKDTLVVDLQYQQENVDITKRFTFNRDSYLIDITYLVDNHSSEPWSANLFGQIKRDDYNPVVSTAFSMKPYLGAAITTPETNYKKIPFKDLRDSSFEVDIQGGWVAMVQHYFISAWVPDADSNNHFKLRKSRGSDYYLLGFTSERSTVAPNTSGEIKASFYAGPKDISALEKISPHLDLTIDFGWLWMIAKPLFFALEFIHDLVGNWGVAIILLTLLVKALFIYPSAMSYRSMAKMRKVQPLMQELKERYGDDRQRMSQELMKLYKKEKVNPLGGCLPVLMQMPVFIALYWVLMESVDLRHAPFIFWIHDLSVRDPYFVLPLIMGATSFIQFKLNPTPPDPMQAKVMQMMPIFFTALFMMFPAGLVLYWVVNNTLSITQQYVITRQIEKSS